MKSLKKAIRLLTLGRRGAALADHGILTALVAVAAIGSVAAVGKKTNDNYCYVVSQVALDKFHERGKCLHVGTPTETPPEPAPEPEAEPEVEPAAITATSGPSCGEYSTGDEMLFTVTYDREVYAETAYIQIDVGGVVRQAQLASGSGTSTLTFSYTLTGDDKDPDGIEYVDHIVYGEVLDADEVAADGDFSETAGDISCAEALPAATCTEDCRYVGMANGELRKLGDDGRPVWTVQADPYPILAIVIDSEGFVYTGGVAVKKWDSDGNMIWQEYGGAVQKMVITRDDRIIAANQHGEIYNYDTDGNPQSPGYQPRVTYRYKSSYGEKVTGLAVDSQNNIFATSHLGLFSMVDPITMHVVWQYHPTNETSTAHIGGVYVDEDDLIYTTEWQPTPKNSDIYHPHSDSAKEEYLGVWQMSSSGYPAVLRAAYGEGYMGQIMAGPNGEIVVMTDNIKGFTGGKMRGYKPGDIYHDWQGFTYGTVYEMMNGEGNYFWTVADRESIGYSYLSRFRHSDGKQYDESGSYTPSTSFESGVRSMAIDLNDLGVDTP